MTRQKPSSAGSWSREWQLLPRAAELVSEQIVKEKRNA